MNTMSTHRPLHPVLWVAAIAVILLSITGIAAIMGLIPTSKSAEPAAIPQSVADVNAPATVAATPPAATTAPIPQAVVKKDASPKRRHVERRAEQITRAEPAAELAPPPPPPPAVCNNCGRIESVQRIVREGEGSGVGAVAGGALGGVVGNNVGSGNGRTLATIAGVVGGALLGNKIEKSRKQIVSYQTTVRFDDGTSRVFNSDHEQGFRDGERVRLVNGEIRPE
ncbi:Glycine zipper 2TM domain-containing protein [Georgfuchsia toluolica]|uniref:Glycine zipper 2TM domain-containing protein n=1 Tax=Georgfuchsia toluolica TaxID=424218 RepID=A0A916J203_9PROT|nr:glycine zipper 2TM domain-containing protein [Georgfuchsia toluolica]CAG4883219.1 Glycine zipper 2TM domain-containing protein [Georgfuchsia toluolica]